MMFREQLEENPGGKTKAQVDAEVTEHRARLIADAEQSSKAETSAKSDSRSGRVRYALFPTNQYLKSVSHLPSSML